MFLELNDHFVVYIIGAYPGQTGGLLVQQRSGFHTYCFIFGFYRTSEQYALPDGTHTHTHTHTHTQHVLTYIYTAGAVVTFFDFSRQQTHKKQTSLLTRGAVSAAQQVDRKLTLIPLAYFVLHIWSIVRSLVSLGSSEKDKTLSTRDNVLLGFQVSISSKIKFRVNAKKQPLKVVQI